jgi:dTMP kinase
VSGFFITFEGTEGSGKSTQIALLSAALRDAGHTVHATREPGGTAVGEEIRHTLKHSPRNQDLTPETELLLMNASRAQLVRERIRPALAAGAVVLCDRFYDSTIAYQGYGRGLDLARVRSIIDFAVDGTRPDLTLWLAIPLEVSQRRRAARLAATVAGAASAAGGLAGAEPLRDRFEEADLAFFSRVEAGFQALARAEPDRVHEIDATRSVEEVAAAILELVGRRLALTGRSWAGKPT